MNFWKRSGQRKSHEKNKVCNGITKKTCSSSTLSSENKLIFLENLFVSVLPKLDNSAEKYLNTSRLSKNLLEVLTDKSALGYFIQYLENRGALYYVKFWLDVESFRSAFETSKISSRICISREELELSQSSRTTTQHSISHDSLSVSTDCDSLTADSISLFEYSSNNSASASESIRTSETVIETNNIPINHSSHSDSKSISNYSPNSNHNKLYQCIVDDASRIFKKYIALDSFYSLRCPEEIRNKIIDSMCENLTMECFDEVQQFVFRIMENEFFNDFIRSGYHCKHQVDILTSGNVVLADILYNETSLFYFMEFLEQEHCRDILEFWIAIRHFQYNFNGNRENLTKQVDVDTHKTDDTVKQIQDDAIIIYDKYFSLQATNSLGFPDFIRLEIEQNICREDGVEISCFNKPLRLVELVLEYNFLKLFLSSELFFKYLSELISAIQMSAYNLSSGSRHRRIGSDSSSEISSISAHNTLLAMEDKKSTKCKKKRNSETDMSIDTRHLYDPDSLWRRNKPGGLTLGRVTDLGRFETGIEPEPDKKSESKIGIVMKRLVHMQEDKAKEEMAWQIAEMIVKDVTSLTMNHESSSF